jgi:hypothetical protein
VHRIRTVPRWQILTGIAHRNRADGGVGIALHL